MNANKDISHAFMTKSKICLFHACTESFTFCPKSRGEQISFSRPKGMWVEIFEKQLFNL